MSHVLRTENLSKCYRSRWVVKDVSFQLKSGEVVGLLGPNGAGKTTSFYMVVGLTACDRGQVFMDNQDITAYAIHQRARLGVGYLPQEMSIFRKLNVRDNILGVLEFRRELSKKARLKKLDELLDSLHISHLSKIMGISLSGGERRRVEIARALAMSPKFMLLDEPFAGVDPISIGDIKQIIDYLTEQHIGILITDHNVRETLDICQRAYIVHDGTIMAEGAPLELMSNTSVQDIYLGKDFKL